MRLGVGFAVEESGSSIRASVESSTVIAFYF